MGSIELVEKCFLDYSTFDYLRSANFETLPTPAYIPEGDPEDGWFEFLYPDGDGYIVKEGPIFDFVFGTDTDQLFNIGAFAQAADDTRAVINYMHNWPVPGEAETAVPCEADPDPEVTYDLAISEMSGLQVPKMLIASTEGIGMYGIDHPVEHKDWNLLREQITRYLLFSTRLPARELFPLELMIKEQAGDIAARSRNLYAIQPLLMTEQIKDRLDAVRRARQLPIAGEGEP